MRRKPLEGGTLERDFLRGNLFDRQDALRNDVDAAARVNITREQADRNYQRIGAQQLFDGWSRTATAGQSAATMDRFGSATFQTLRRAAGGSVTRLEVVSSAARTAGSCTIEVYIDGAASGLTAVLDAENTTFVVEEAALGEFEYAAGEPITVRMTTTAGWTPTSAVVFVILWLSE